MLRHINKSIASGQVQAPPSKSYAHRLLIGAALCDNDVTVDNIELSNDIIATIKCITSLGKKVDYDEISRTITITKGSTENNLFDCNESGSTLRFFIPIVIALKQKGLFIGTKRLMERGLGIYEEIFNTLGIKYEKTLESIEVFGSLVPYRYLVKGNISSQFITGLLFSLPLLDGDSIIEIIPPVESVNYIFITLDVLRKFGIKIDADLEKNIIYIKGNQKYSGSKYIVEGDYSNAAFLDVYNYIGGNVKVLGLNEDSLQGDKVYKKYFEILNNENFPTIDIKDSIDLGPILFTFAAIKNGATITGIKRLAIKESNRIVDVLSELEKFGVTFYIEEDKVKINKCKLHKPTKTLNSHNDHRITMSLVAILSLFGGDIEGTNSVNKSYPTYFSTIKDLGIEVDDDAIER
jgi:3-phosphoshikimate 1-carboxyvinyltransferase